MKTYKLIALASLASLFMAACTKNAEVENPATENNVNTITPATFEAVTDEVKLSLDGVTPSWDAGDSLYVLQYGYWKIEEGEPVYRDTTYNVFKTTGSTTFTGGIANFKIRDTQSKETKGCGNSFYAIYPASVLKKYSISTSTSTLYVSPSQTGLLSEVGKHLTFKGGVSEKMDTTVKFENNVITFLVPFTLKCCTPLIKFNVPTDLDLTKIVITASNDTADVVKLSGKYESRLSPGAKNWKKPKSDTLAVYRDGNQISGDVYVVLAPERNFGNDNILTDIKTMKFALTNSKGWTANIKVSLSETTKAGTLKVLPTFPKSVNWKKPIGPGLATMSCSAGIESNSTYKNKKKIGLSPENPSSIIKYSSCSYSGDNTCIDTLSAPTKLYVTADSIATNDLVNKVAFPANFSKIQVETENCHPYTCKAITWKLSSRVGFGEWFGNNIPSSITAEVTTVPASGYQYGLSFLYSTYSSNTKNLPQINSSCFFLYHGNTSAPYYCDGKLSFVAPETGTATMYFNQTGLASGKKVKILKGSTTVSEGVALPAGDYKSSSFAVSKGDVITIYASGKFGLYSMTFLWVPDTDN